MDDDMLNIDQIVDAREILKGKFKAFIENYIAETESLLLEIDVYRSGERDADIIEIVHQLKSSSFQVGAARIMDISNQIYGYIHNNNDNLLSMNAQIHLDSLFCDLRASVQEYKKVIFDYL